MAKDPFVAEISRRVWAAKYRLEGEGSIDGSWRRIAHALAEGENDPAWESRFYSLLQDFRFLPGGRILAGAGSNRQVTLFNCFVMGTVEDSMTGIFDALKEGALTMQQGGGVGYDFSTLRPSGSPAHNVGTIASGPVSFMRIWDSMCATILSSGARRGAMMATLRCDHPDIETFIDAKRDAHELRHFNLSVLVSDDFMTAVERDEPWPLLFPAEADDHGGDYLERVWSGYYSPVRCRVYKQVSARALWDRLMQSAYDVAEPGVLFVDRINTLNNLNYRERLTATNPCGEIPLPPYGACNLGSLNLTTFVRDPFSVRATFDMEALAANAAVAVRMLDRVIDYSRFPLPAQQAQAKGARRIGLGITGLADTLIMLNLAYDSEEGRSICAGIMEKICHTAYATSVALAQEKRPFSFFERDDYLAGEFVQRLPQSLQDDIAQHGIRNSHLTAIAPAGTISLLANNVSSGLEPVYAASARRRLLQSDGSACELEVEDYAYHLWRSLNADKPLPDVYRVAEQLSPEAHLQMQAALQPYVDNAISKTINVPADYSFDAFRHIYQHAYALGLKGCTCFRPNPVTGAVLTADDAGAAQCCLLDDR